ncbi:MAG: hypothetical protein ACYSUI_05595 [Planctomycetota bacterium]
MARRPDLKGQLKRWMQANGVSRGVPVRKRADFKYSRVGIAYNGAGDFPANDPTALFTVQIGGQDSVLGQITEVDTNVVNAGKQDSAELFKAHAIGFVPQLVSANNATTDDIAELWRALMINTSAVLNLGTQNKQRFPTLQALPGINTGFQLGGSTPNVVVEAATQGKQSLIRFDPPVYLGAGESYSVELKIKRALQVGGLTVPLLPSGIPYQDVLIAIQCVMYGVSYTGIPG